jgi:lipopolysaccharide biosynthesis protein
LKKDKSLLIAHYHSEGKIREDLCNFIKKASKSFNNIIFISTKLNKIEKIKIDKYALIISRPNYGYDFYSYKIGLAKLLKENKKKNEVIFFIGSNLIFINPTKLLNQIDSNLKIKKKIHGLSKSWEIEEHLQTDMISIPTKYFYNKNFYNWWKKIKKFKKRSTIIGKYELGFSQFLNKNNIEYDCFFKDNINDYPNNILKLFKKKIENIFFKNIKIYKKNPTHFYWKRILNKFGVIKIDLIKTNSNNVDIENLKKILGNKKYKDVKIEADNN